MTRSKIAIIVLISCIGVCSSVSAQNEVDLRPEVSGLTLSLLKTSTVSQLEAKGVKVIVPLKGQPLKTKDVKEQSIGVLCEKLKCSPRFFGGSLLLIKNQKITEKITNVASDPTDYDGAALFAPWISYLQRAPDQVVDSLASTMTVDNAAIPEVGQQIAENTIVFLDSNAFEAEIAADVAADTRLSIKQIKSQPDAKLIFQLIPIIFYYKDGVYSGVINYDFSSGKITVVEAENVREQQPSLKSIFYLPANPQGVAEAMTDFTSVKGGVEQLSSVLTNLTKKKSLVVGEKKDEYIYISSGNYKSENLLNSIKLSFGFKVADLDEVFLLDYDDYYGFLESDSSTNDQVEKERSSRYEKLKKILLGNAFSKIVAPIEGQEFLANGIVNLSDLAPEKQRFIKKILNINGNKTQDFQFRFLVRLRMLISSKTAKSFVGGNTVTPLYGMNPVKNIEEDVRQEWSADYWNRVLERGVFLKDNGIELSF